MQFLEFSYPSADGLHTIHAAQWVPQGRPRGVVQIVHGVAEHIGRYDAAARFLCSHGFLVCGEDHLGHGRTASDGKFGYFAPRGGWELVVRDIRRLRELVGEQHPGVFYSSRLWQEAPRACRVLRFRPRRARRFHPHS